MASKPKIVLTARDAWILSIMQLGPLDCNQIQRLSQSLANPFPDPHAAAKRMRRLTDKGLLNKFTWLDGRIGTTNYYVLTTAGRKLMAFSGTLTKAMFRAVSISNERHTHKVADVNVTTVLAAEQLGIEITEHTGDNQFVAAVGPEEELLINKPDSRCVLVGPQQRVEMWDEIDLSTESVKGVNADSLERKIAFHVDRRWENPEEDYIVRVFFLHEGQRMQHFLEVAKRYAVDNQFLFLATTIDRYCQDPAPLTNPIFRDHAGRNRRCFKTSYAVRQPTLAETPRNSLPELVAA